MLAAIVCLVGCGSSGGVEPDGPSVDRKGALAAAETWMYQIQDLNLDGAIEDLDDTDYPLLVLEPGHNHRACDENDDPPDGYPQCAPVYDTEAILTALRETPEKQRRLLVAYIDVGQAEDWRDYWGKDWVAPTSTKIGNPTFMLLPDADDWEGNFTVAFWDPAWKDLWTADDGIIPELARMGFDGVYLDWVEAYEDDGVVAEAELQGRNPVAEMLLFLGEIRDAGRAVTPDFLVIQQNAPWLYEAAGDHDAMVGLIDGLACEDTWWYGSADAPWEAGTGGYDYTVADRAECEQEHCSETLVAPDNVCLPANRDDSYDCDTMPVAGGLHGGQRHDDNYDTASRLGEYEEYTSRGVPVFTVDYLISAENAQAVYDAGWGADLRPLATRVSLQRNTETPPWDFE